MNYTKLSKTQFGGDTINLSFKSNLVSMMNTYKTFLLFKCKLVDSDRNICKYSYRNCFIESQ